MSSFLEVSSYVAPWAVAVGSTWVFHGKTKAAQRATQHERQQREALAQQLADLDDTLQRFSTQGVHTLQNTGNPHFPLPIPGMLVGSPLADRLQDVSAAVASVIQRERHAGQTSAASQIAEARQTAETDAEKATRAAVRSVGSSVVALLSRLNKQISEGLDQTGDDAHAAMLAIDRLAQQLLLHVQSYVILSGGKLSRRSPDTSLTDVIRAAMGHLNGFERIEHDEPDVAVTARAVGPTIHALAVLLDNALRYSPKTAPVEVRIREGHHGVTIMIDDAGIQMNADQLAAARRILVSDQNTDLTRLGAHPSTGFPVVAALCRDYGFRADLDSPNPLQGTRATLFLPKNLLTTLTAPEPASVPAAAAAANDAPAATTAGGLAIRQRRAPTPAVPGPRRQPDEATASPARPGSPGVAGAWHKGIQQARIYDITGNE